MMKLKDRSKELYALLEKEMPEGKKTLDKKERAIEEPLKEMEKTIKKSGDFALKWRHGNEKDAELIKKIIDHFQSYLDEKTGNWAYHQEQHQKVKDCIFVLSKLKDYYEGKIEFPEKELGNHKTKEDIKKYVHDTWKILKARTRR